MKSDPPMRVLHIGKYYPPYKGGMENFLRDLLDALSASGVSVSALVHHHEQGAGMSLEREAGFPVLRVPSWGQAVYVPLSPSFPYYLRDHIKRFRPDVLHLHFPNPSAFWCLFIPVARAVPWVIHWHSDVVPSGIDRRLRLFYQGYKPFEQSCLRRSKSVICTSRPYLEASLPLKRWVSKCGVVPLGLNPERFFDSEDEGFPPRGCEWPEGGLRVLAVGRLTYYKGFEFLIRAAQAVENISVQIVGGGDLEESLKREIALRRVGHRVFLRGEVSDAALRSMLSTCDCLCLPSVERTEAFGLVLLEAMRYGKALVASDIPGSGVGWELRKSRGG